MAGVDDRVHRPAGEDRRYEDRATAAGYAADRPPAHRPIVAAALDLLGPPARPRRLVVDLGCGAGASTAPLLALAPRVLAVDPAPAMVAATRTHLPDALTAIAVAEALPLADGIVDLIVAAGSLDHVDLGRFGPEAARALHAEGAVVAYDFARGRHLAGGDRTDDPLDRWYGRYLERSGRPPRAGQLPDRLAAVPGLRLATLERLIVPIALPRHRYVAYVLTDAADPADPGLRNWCDRTLPATVDDHAVIAFDAYVAILRPR